MASKRKYKTRTSLDDERTRIRRILSFVIASKLSRFWRESRMTPIESRRFDDLADEILGVIVTVTKGE